MARTLKIALLVGVVSAENHRETRPRGHRGGMMGRLLRLSVYATVLSVGITAQPLGAQSQQINPPEYEFMGIGSVDTALGKFWNVAVGVERLLSEGEARDLFCHVALRQVEAAWSHWSITVNPSAIERPEGRLRSPKLAFYEWGGGSLGPRSFMLAVGPSILSSRQRDIETPFDHTTDCE